MYFMNITTETDAVYLTPIPWDELNHDHAVGDVTYINTETLLEGRSKVKDSKEQQEYETRKEKKSSGNSSVVKSGKGKILHVPVIYLFAYHFLLLSCIMHSTIETAV